MLGRVKVFTGVSGCYHVESQHNFESTRGVEALSTLGKAFVQRDRYDLLSSACIAAALAACRGRLNHAVTLPKLQLLHGAADSTVRWADSAAFAVAAAGACFDARASHYRRTVTDLRTPSSNLYLY